MRFVAAMLVFFTHFGFLRFTGGTFYYFQQFGHSAVIAFFVLSGYVISFVSDTKEKDMRSYYIGRFSRLYSVVLPVLILVPILDYIGMSFNEVLYEGKQESNYFIIRLLANLAFLQQIWFYGIKYLSVGPLWSLGYEFWYYVLFSLFIYVKGYKKYLLIGMTSLLIGPKILLLMPAWILGVFIYYFHKEKELNKIIARIIFFSTPVLFYSFHKYRGDPIIDLSSYGNFSWSTYFLHDYITAIIVGLLIISVKYIDISAIYNSLIKMETTIRYFATRSFTLYLFHYPLLFFYGAVLNHDPNSAQDIIILGIVTFLTCLLIAEYTERKKYVFKKNISFLFEKTLSRFGRA